MFTLILALAALQSNDDWMFTAHEQGAAWAKGGVSPACIAQTEPEPDLRVLKTAEGKQAAAFRAQMLAGLYAGRVKTNDALRTLARSIEPTQKQLLAQGEITRAQYDFTITQTYKEIKDGERMIADSMREHSACNFFRLLGASPTVQNAKAILRTKSK